MNAQFSLFSNQWLLSCACLLLWCAIPVHALSQQSSDKGASYTYDENDRVVAISYYGSSGFKESAPKNVTHVKAVDIPYGTTLTKEDIAYISTLETVEELTIGGSSSGEFADIESSLEPLAQLKRLDYVLLCKRDMSDDDLKFVAELPQIQYLEFFGATDSLSGQGSTVTDACAESIRRATSLRELCIYFGENLSDQFVADISRDLENLEHLHLDSERLTDQALKVIAEELANLRWLDLNSNHFTDKGISYLAGAKKLEMLWLESTSLTNHCVKSIASLKSLRHLELTFPNIMDDEVEALASLPALEILALRSPPLTDQQFALFANHPTLESAFLNGRDLSIQEVLKILGTIPKLKHLSVGNNEPLQKAINNFLASRRPTFNPQPPEF